MTQTELIEDGYMPVASVEGAPGITKDGLIYWDETIPLSSIEEWQVRLTDRDGTIIWLGDTHEPT